MFFAPLIDVFHISSILAMFIFQASVTALCRHEWFNAASLTRLLRVYKIYLFCIGLTLVSGITEFLYGKHGVLTGVDFLTRNALLHTKFVIFIIFSVLAYISFQRIKNWHKNYLTSGQLPSKNSLDKERRFILIQAHLLIILPFLGVFISHGYG